jgi:hypothetical protein
LHLNSQHPGKTESSITINSEESPNNDDDILAASDGQFNSQFDFCGGADESVCACLLNSNKISHAKVSFHKKLKYSYQETASSKASCNIKEDNFC